MRTAHGDFDWYHRKYNHDDAKLTCSCGRAKSPEHLALCAIARHKMRHWPLRPRPRPPANTQEALDYLQSLAPKDFAELLRVTEFYSKICTR